MITEAAQSVHDFASMRTQMLPAPPRPQETWARPPKSKQKAVDEAWLWGYVPALDPRGMQRGLLHHGDPARLRRAVAKLLAGEPTVVAAVGGSISVGRGSATQVRTDGRRGVHRCRCGGALRSSNRGPTSWRRPDGTLRGHAASLRALPPGLPASGHACSIPLPPWLLLISGRSSPAAGQGY